MDRNTSLASQPAGGRPRVGVVAVEAWFERQGGKPMQQRHLTFKFIFLSGSLIPWLMTTQNHFEQAKLKF